MINNAKVLASTIENRFRIVTGGTDTHVVLVDVGSKNIKGNDAESLGNANITCNKNVFHLILRNLWLPWN